MIDDSIIQYAVSSSRQLRWRHFRPGNFDWWESDFCSPKAKVKDQQFH